MNIRTTVVGEKIELVPESLNKEARGKPLRVKFRRTSTNDIMAATYDPIKGSRVHQRGLFSSCGASEARQDLACN
jgi:hypothetical protein